MQIYARPLRTSLSNSLRLGHAAFARNFRSSRSVLDIDGDTIPESEVIAEYLEEPIRTVAVGHSARNARIRTLARISDIYI